MRLAENKAILVDATDRLNYRHKDRELQKNTIVENTKNTLDIIGNSP